ARTPVAGIVHSVTLLLIMMYFGRWVGFIPIPTLAGVLIVVAYHMSEWRSSLSIIHNSNHFALVYFLTFLITVLVDLTVAIEVGLITAMLMFIKEMSQQTNVSAIWSADDETVPTRDRVDSYLAHKLPKGVMLFEFNGPLFFGAAYKFKEALIEMGQNPSVLIINMQFVPMIDSTGIHVLEEAVSRFLRKGTRVIVSGAQFKVLRSLNRAGLVQKIGRDKFKPNLDDAIAIAKEAPRVAKPRWSPTSQI
ncbi:MAG: STAS domain-containing protein, partial [Candidatus Margulisiibacteriota bacterium]